MGDINEMKDKATERAKECVDRLKNVDWKAKGEQAKAKAKEIASKENIDKVKKGIKNGVADLKTAEGRDRLKASAVAGATSAKNKIVATWNSGPKGKAICVGAAILGFALIGMFCGDDETLADGVSMSDDEINLSGNSFSSIFIGSRDADEGVIYRHSQSPSIQVLQSTGAGLLVGYVTGANPWTAGIENFMENMGGSYDRLVFVKTDGDGYEDGEQLRSGFYVRNGSFSYEGVDGGEHTIACYSEITKHSAIKRIEAVIERRKDEESEAAIAAEGDAIEVDVPIKSFCGFVFGSTPSQNWGMFKENEGRRFTHTQSENFSYEDSGTLVKPFRWFTKGKIEFSFVPGTQECLESVTLESADFDFNKVTVNSVLEEVKKVKGVIEKKFGIELTADSYGQSDRSFSWHHGKSSTDVESLSLYFSSDRLYLNVHCWQVAKRAKSIKAANKKSISLSDDAGKDDL